MADATFYPPQPKNEPINSYAPGTEARKALKAKLKAMKEETADIPMFINGEEVRTDNTVDIHPPFELAHKLGHFHKGGKEHVEAAVEAALAAQPSWERMPWQDRAAIFLRAADLIAGPYRDAINAATMLGQGKTAFQAEIDSACELIDFLRFNVHFMTQIYKEQPISSPGVWNRLEYRPLEGFIFAVTPFNFTAIAGNLPSAPAMLGNVVVWKPASTQVYSANIIMKVFREAGLPAGVINLIFTDGPVAGDVVFNHPDFAGLHFTGSTGTFQFMWETIGKNIRNYKGYPRIVGETGGKDFVVAHPSADAEQVAVALARGAFEFQGQKCSAASRAYLPTSLWGSIKERLVNDVKSMKMGSPEDFSNFLTCVIDEAAFDKISNYISEAKKADDAEIIVGGGFDKSKGYFIEPTVIVTSNPQYITMREEIFGPVLTIYVYEDAAFEETLELTDTTSPYALTGSIFAKDREVLNHATDKLKHAAGNFYINDKPTGAVVGQQPFGGGRASGTNDKAGSVLNLYRWLSPRSIKETFVAARDYRYPFMDEE